jgi:hypothetical protein
MKTSENSFVPEEAVEPFSDSINVKIREMAQHRRDMATASFRFLNGEISKEEFERIAKISQDELFDILGEQSLPRK